MKVCPLTGISSSAPEIGHNVLLTGMSSTWKEYSCTAIAQRNTQSFWSGILGVYDWSGV